MTRSTTSPPTASDRSRLSRHQAAVARTLSWADEAAAHHDFAGALECLAMVEAIGDSLSDEHQRKRVAWAVAQERVL